MQTIRHLRSIFILLMGVVWITVSADTAGISNNGDITSPYRGFMAPDFRLETLTGDEVALSDMRGKVVIVNFWASWCRPCQKEMPAFLDVYEEFRDQGLMILAVNSTSEDNLVSVEKFVSEHQLTFPILLDRDGQVGRLYYISALPTTFFIGRDGIITKVIIGGPLAEATLRSELEILFGEEKP